MVKYKANLDIFKIMLAISFSPCYNTPSKLGGIPMQLYEKDQLAEEYVQSLSQNLRKNYTIDPNQFKSLNVKRGLRNIDGTGVLAGVTNIGSVQGYMMLDGDPIPMPGRLYYRGIEINELMALAYRDIGQNANAKVVFYDLALKMIVLILKK